MSRSRWEIGEPSPTIEITQRRTTSAPIGYVELFDQGDTLALSRADLITLIVLVDRTLHTQPNVLALTALRDKLTALLAGSMQ